MNIEDLKFYLIKNAEGKYFRAKGYRGYGDSWTEVDKARIYCKLRLARTQVTVLSNLFPTHPYPIIIEVSAGKISEINESDRLDKSRLDKEKAKVSSEERNKREQLLLAQKDYDTAKQRLNQLKGA